MPKDFAQLGGRPGDGWIPVYRLNDRVVWKNRFEDIIAVTRNSRLSLLSGADSVQIFQDGKYVLMSSSGPRRDVEVIVYKGDDSKPLLMVKANSADRKRKVVFLQK